MWTEITQLLQPDFEADSEEEERFFAAVQDVNDWLFREHPALNCEQITRAYNLLVNEELTKADGKVLNAYARIDARHVGEVLAAYKRYVNNNQQVSDILQRGLYLPVPTVSTQDAIDAEMEVYYMQALDHVLNGLFYDDPGNGLAKWLHSKDRFFISQDQWNAARTQAENDVRQDLDQQKKTASRLGNVHYAKIIEQRLDHVLNGSGDATTRINERTAKICLNNHLQMQAGGFGQPLQAKPLPTTPKVANVINMDYDHNAWSRQLLEKLPAMPTSVVEALQKQALSQNVLDVYTWTTDELNKRKDAEISSDDKRRVSGTSKGTELQADARNQTEIWQTDTEKIDTTGQPDSGSIQT